MRATETMIVWTPAKEVQSFAKTAGRVSIFEHPDRNDRARGYLKSVGACIGSFHDLSPDQRLAQLFIWFNTMVVRDGIAPHVAHEAFLKIDEYAEAIDRGIPGAREVEPHLVGLTVDLDDDLVADLKSVPTVEEATAKILDAASLGKTGEVLSLLRRALQAELDCKKPVHLNVQALWFALQVEGTLDPAALDKRWHSILDALRNA